MDRPTHARKISDIFPLRAHKPVCPYSDHMHTANPTLGGPQDGMQASETARGGLRAGASRAEDSLSKAGRGGAVSAAHP